MSEHAKEAIRKFLDFYACEVCGNAPNLADGELEHGRGCYVVEEDGGGRSYIEFDERQLEFAINEALTAARESDAKELAELRRERDAWKNEWSNAIKRIGGPSNEAAAGRVAQHILETLCRWRDARRPGPFVVDAELDKEAFVTIIKNAISARTDELESQLTKLTASD